MNFASPILLIFFFEEIKPWWCLTKKKRPRLRVRWVWLWWYGRCRWLTYTITTSRCWRRFLFEAYIYMSLFVMTVTMRSSKFNYKSTVTYLFSQKNWCLHEYICSSIKESWPGSRVYRCDDSILRFYGWVMTTRWRPDVIVEMTGGHTGWTFLPKWSDGQVVMFK